jgi:hypothetical protein
MRRVMKTPMVWGLVAAVAAGCGSGGAISGASAQGKNNAALDGAVIGYMDNFQEDVDGNVEFWGWACQVGNPNPLLVSLSGSGYGGFLTNVTANLASEDAVANACGFAHGSFRFDVKVPWGTVLNLGYLGPTGTSVYAQAENLTSGASAWLTRLADYRITTPQPTLGDVGDIVKTPTGTVVTGWACIVGYDQPIKVGLSETSSPFDGIPNLYDVVDANLPGANDVDTQAIAQQCQAHGKTYRFQIPLNPYWFKEGSHYYVYAIRPTRYGGLLNFNSDRNFIPPPVSIGYIDGLVLVSGVPNVFGWACTPGWLPGWKNLSTPSAEYVQIVSTPTLGVGTTYLAAGEANLPNEPAVDNACQTTGINHRFMIPIYPPYPNHPEWGTYSLTTPIYAFARPDTDWDPPMPLQQGGMFTLGDAH